MIKGKLFFTSILLAIIFFSCKKDEFDKYGRPEWLAGKVYSQIKETANLSTFAKCLELTGYDQIIDISGSYTVFAPTDEAFIAFFQQHQSYKKLEDIPLPILDELVKYHIVQNPWSLSQLRSLDVNGWIDAEDPYNNKPRGFKRETLLLKDDSKFGVKNIGVNVNEFIIIDTTLTNWHRRVATDSRKYAPLFYREFFDIYKLQLNDYAFYFDRFFEDPSDIYFVDAKIISDEIFAENGFVYAIDKVVEPLRNVNEILRKGKGDMKYNKFIDLVNNFANFSYNERKTFEQAGANLGLKVDSLFDLNYPMLAFNITSEKTKAPSGGAGMPEEVSIRFHHGLIAPTNEAFDEFVNQYVVGHNQWGSLELMPKRILKIIANSYFTANPVFDTDINTGFYNGEDDIVRLDYSTIVQKEFGSNATFIGVNKPIIPRAFKSVTGPVYRQRGYSTVMNAIEFTGLLSALKREGQDYALFVPDDATTRADSSLLYTYFRMNNIVQEYFDAITPFPSIQSYRLDKNSLRLLLLNQIAVERPRWIARKEFLKTMAGNHIIWDHTTGIVKGTANTVRGYLGGELIDIKPVKISIDADNGDTYNVNSWFSFSTTELYGMVSINFPQFHALINKAGFALDKEYRYSFLSQNQFYTVFAPSAEAISAISADTLTGENLKRFVQLHFIEGSMIFTDGRMAEGYYPTAYSRPVALGQPAQKVNVYIKPGTDVIGIAHKNGGTYATVEESPSTNRITARSLNRPGETTLFPNIISTGVVHRIDTAFDYNLIDIK